jgi:DNA invertase Pin-like site-specific DNA recombinase
MMGAFAEFERSIIRKPQAEGIAKAKAKGVYRGRKSSIDIEKVKKLNSEGKGASVIAKELGIGRASVYRLLGQMSVKENRKPEKD